AVGGGGRRGGGLCAERRRSRGRRRRCDGGVLAALLALDPAQPVDVLLVLVVVFGEHVAAGAVGDEEDFLGARRVGGGFERGAARIGDRSGWQALDHIGVVRRRLADLALQDRPPERVLAADQAVDDGRVRLQLDPLLEAIDEHGGDAGALLRLAGLLLDDGRERDELVGRLERKVRRAMVPDILDQAALCRLHALDYLLTR